MMRSRTLAFVCICFIAFAIQQCKRDDRSQTDKSTITIQYPGDERIMGPSQEAEPMFMVFLPFAKENKTGELEGRLATSWEHSEDYRTWTVHLRDDVKWHDGVSVTAHDVKFTLDLLEHPDVLAIDRRGLLRVLNMLEEIPIPDAPYTKRMLKRGELSEHLPYDPSEAERLLEGAGWRDTDGDGIREKEGQEFRFEAIVLSSREWERMAVFVQDNYRRIGIKMDLRLMSGSALRARVRAVRGDLSAIFSRFSSMPDFLQEYLGPESIIGYHNPEVYSLIDQLPGAVDPDDLDRIVRQLAEILREDQPVTFLMPRVITFIAPISIRAFKSPWENSVDAQPNKTLNINNKSDKILRYVNPLVLENAGRLADPTVIKFEGKYYLYLTGGISPYGSSRGGVWSSEDLVHWDYHQVETKGARGIGAPTAFDYKGYVYLTGNDIGLYRSRSPLGPFEYFGDFVDKNGQRLERERDPGQGWEDGGVFDPAIFVDDDDRVYLYYAGGSTAGVYGVELDSKDLRKFLDTPKHFFRFETTHIWERYGNWNEYSDQSWIEGPWMTKHKGTYYLQYAAPGTDWKTYAVGVYTSKNPLGPYKYYEESPILLHKGGLINGCAHHSTVEGPDGNLWAIYTLLYRNWNRMFERRIGMDPVGFDTEGNMFIKGPSETPQWAPGVKSKPWEDNDSGSYPLSEDKNYTVSSEAPGRNAPYAVDNNNRTWWAPTKDDKEPWLTLDLGAESRQTYIVDSTRILFMLPEGDLWDEYRLGGDEAKPRIRQYKIEVSSDGKTFTTVVDKTKNDRDNAVEFDEIKPIKCRHVRLTITGWPKDLPCGVLEFTVFGKPTPQ